MIGPIEFSSPPRPNLHERAFGLLQRKQATYPSRDVKELWHHSSLLGDSLVGHDSGGSLGADVHVATYGLKGDVLRAH